MTADPTQTPDGKRPVEDPAVDATVEVIKDLEPNEGNADEVRGGFRSNGCVC